MYGILTDVHVGRKNIAFGIALFLVFGVVIGIPLTINLFGGSVLSDEQYQAWKVVHGYAVFLAFINYFFGLVVDRLSLTQQQKEVSSWSFIIAGLFGAVTRMTLLLLSAPDAFRLYASLGETVFITLGTVLVVWGQIRGGAFSGLRRRTADISLRGHSGTA